MINVSDLVKVKRIDIRKRRMLRKCKSFLTPGEEINVTLKKDFPAEVGDIIKIDWDNSVYGHFRVTYVNHNHASLLRLSLPSFLRFKIHSFLHF